MTWHLDVDEEFGGDLLRWDDGPIIAQVLGEDEEEARKAYAALVAAVVHSGRAPHPADGEAQ